MRRRGIRRVRLLAPLTFMALWSAPAFALTATITTNEPSVVGEVHTFNASVGDASGTVRYRWKFGDGEAADFAAGASVVKHAYAAPGHLSVLLSVQDDGGNNASDSVIHTVHYPLSPRPPATSSPIVYDPIRNRIYSVNQDNDTVAVIDAGGLKKLGEVSVYQRPEALALAPDGALWVLHRDDYAVAVVDPDRLLVERGFRLPYASQPIGLAFSPTGDAAYVTLMAAGKLLKLDPKSGAFKGQLDVGPWPRGVAVSSDGRDLFVTRFISANSGGEVVHVDGLGMKLIERVTLAPDTTTTDGDQEARGLPNYLLSVAISPDGRQAWIPGKKDNVFRGVFLDEKPLNQDDTARPLVAVLDLSRATENPADRIDLDDRNLPSFVAFSPLGDYAFITLTGSNFIEVRDAYTHRIVTVIMGAGQAPRATALGPDERLFVQGSLSRDVRVYDLHDLLALDNQTTPHLLATIGVVDHERLPAEVLLGKQIFYNSSDGRMTKQGYLSCATCHFDGFEDGRVYDFTSRGEGLRNTTSLLGRRGAGQGRVHWSGNFDEIQDFEQEIRELFLGSGFIPDDVLATGTRKDPLGAPKQGLSKELDALAAYVTSLDRVNPSPFRNADGSLTPDAEKGKTHFAKLGCNFCHAGADFTDSGRGMLHDVGTIRPSSGTRSGAPLLGIDTPTLLGVWETAPYLHDGSAATLRDVLTTKNLDDAHGFVSSLPAAEIDELVAYLRQIDNQAPVRRLPFESATGTGGAADGLRGQGGAPGPTMSETGGATGAQNGGGQQPGAGGGIQTGCACTLVSAHDRPAAEMLVLVASFWWVRARRSRRRRQDREGELPIRLRERTGATGARARGKAPSSRMADGVKCPLTVAIQATRPRR